MTPQLTDMIAAGSCGALVAITEPVTIRILRRAAAIDIPNGRSSHSVPTPRGGGAPIAAGLVLAALLIRSPAAIALAVAVAAFAVIGLADDLSGLPARTRLAWQAAGATAAAAVVVLHLHLPPAVAAAAVIVVAVELVVISWIRYKYMDTPFLSAAFQVIIGGVLVFIAGILIGRGAE